MISFRTSIQNHARHQTFLTNADRKPKCSLSGDWIAMHCDWVCDNRNAGLSEHPIIDKRSEVSIFFALSFYLLFLSCQSCWAESRFRHTNVLFYCLCDSFLLAIMLTVGVCTLQSPYGLSSLQERRK